jgi:hypothetical protein
MVSERKHKIGLEHPWPQAVRKAREALGLVGYVPVGGNTREGQELYKKAKSIYDETSASSSSEMLRPVKSRRSSGRSSKKSGKRRPSKSAGAAAV